MQEMPRNAQFDNVGGWIAGTVWLYARNSALASMLLLLLSFFYAVAQSIINFRIGSGADHSLMFAVAALLMTAPVAYEFFAARAKPANDGDDLARSVFLNPAPTGGAEIRTPEMDDLYRGVVKRMLDILLAGFLLLMLMPIFCLLIIVIRADGGPAFYSHRRVGRGGHAFGCLKFRSMVVNADERLAKLLNADPVALAEWQATWKLRSDPRVTRIGRLLRATSLDELPQLINVLRGEMSLVGPRPLTDWQLEMYYGRDAAPLYFSVRPGMTGPWQVSDRSDATYSKRVAYDVTYVRNQSLVTDLRILLRTISRLLTRHGAY